MSLLSLFTIKVRLEWLKESLIDQYMSNVSLQICRFSFKFVLIISNIFNIASITVKLDFKMREVVDTSDEEEGKIIMLKNYY